MYGEIVTCDLLYVCTTPSKIPEDKVYDISSDISLGLREHLDITMLKVWETS